MKGGGLWMEGDIVFPQKKRGGQPGDDGFCLRDQETEASLMRSVVEVACSRFERADDGREAEKVKYRLRDVLMSRLAMMFFQHRRRSSLTCAENADLTTVCGSHRGFLASGT